MLFESIVMRQRKLLIKIIGFGLVLGSFSLVSQLLAENKTTCPKDFPESGMKFKSLGNNEWKIIVTESKSLHNALNNESLEEHLELLKLDAVERFQTFLKSKVYSTPTKNGGTKLIEIFDSSWDQMKRSIASMKELTLCVQENRILFIGGWSSESIYKANKIIEIQELFDELFTIEMEDPKFDFDALLKKYPMILITEDPEVLRKIINSWRKNGIF